eukprot:CAMPEP_0117434590 /NCGR_PEP_ID=MMETSP0759-20121206/31_1 /TAXON_ID=63605 /ORGANISM="Percolomonas cosmopolitus, Strain WS" /LENGTH=307 /DNA_ID=CAMNT_0005226085 /DNA_START=1352 /DNA_END=2275 /DNA_ORIENTATION=-
MPKEQRETMFSDLSLLRFVREALERGAQCKPLIRSASSNNCPPSTFPNDMRLVLQRLTNFDVKILLDTQGSFIVQAHSSILESKSHFFAALLQEEKYHMQEVQFTPSSMSTGRRDEIVLNLSDELQALVFSERHFWPHHHNEENDQSNKSSHLSLKRSPSSLLPYCALVKHFVEILYLEEYKSTIDNMEFQQLVRFIFLLDSFQLSDTDALRAYTVEVILGRLSPPNAILLYRAFEHFADRRRPKIAGSGGARSRRSQSAAPHSSLRLFESAKIYCLCNYEQIKKQQDGDLPKTLLEKEQNEPWLFG